MKISYLNGMKDGQKLWTREELILAVNLYCKLPFGKMHKSNLEIIKLAELIGRTPSSISFKLVNFASFDPTLRERGIKGASNASKLDKEIWNEFYNNWDVALIESEKLMAKVKKTTVEKLNDIDISDIPKEGLEKTRLVKTRVNQCIFRTIILATYNNKCCITGISNPELLIASHILPWSKDEKNRMNPMNGLALNALHDKAFEVGLITIDAATYKVRVSPSLNKKGAPESIKQNFLDYEGKDILLPDKFLPDREFLKLHNNARFRS
jgi:putative restriction endonuclease